MSNKAYLFRLRTQQDVNDLKSLFDCGTVPIWMEFLYKPNKSIKSFKKTDLVAAITVDRGDLRLAFYEEANVKKTSHLYFLRLEELKYFLKQDEENNSFVSDWELIEANEDNWYKIATKEIKI
tara:strand:- start:32 stop:400 length:369 start_codon:yes stop_codon:yes gene_type:complete